MGDLFAARVGHGQAAILLRDVTGRSKGGWLYKDLKKWWAKQEERFPWLKGKSQEEQKKDEKKGESPPEGDDLATAGAKGG
jgi:hypothetical protein